MVIARWLVLLLAFAAVVCFGLFIGTKDRRHLQRGLTIVKWTIVAGFVFFGVLIVERLVE